MGAFPDTVIVVGICTRFVCNWKLFFISAGNKLSDCLQGFLIIREIATGGRN